MLAIELVRLDVQQELEVVVLTECTEVRLIEERRMGKELWVGWDIVPMVLFFG